MNQTTITAGKLVIGERFDPVRPAVFILTFIDETRQRSDTSSRIATGFP